jgi:SecD/SecF fusion protein
MQFKGLVRFFTILLIIYSIYQLSFTWFVKGHEKKLQAAARAYVATNYQTAAEKFPNNKDSQAVYQEELDKAYEQRLKKLEDSTKDQTLTYGITGAVSYQKAKEEELNLGLDLQGGMNVTLEVEMTGLLKTLANQSRDTNFLKALSSAEKKKANSDKNFVSLFASEYQALVGNDKMSSLFYAANRDKIKIGDSDAKVISVLNEEAQAAFSNTYRVLNTRIDQFGVAQPTISPQPERGIISVELPGIKDKDRVRKYLQSSANLQFWETYTSNNPQIINAFQQADNDFNIMMGGRSADTTTVKTDTTATKDTNATSPNPDTTLAGQLDSKKDTGGLSNANDLTPQGQKRSLGEFLQPSSSPTFMGMVNTRDTGTLREYLESPNLKRHFPADLRFAYGIPDKADKKRVPLYALKTYGREKAEIEGDAVTKSRQDYDPTTSRPIVTMEMNSAGATKWDGLTARSASATSGFPIAIVLDGIVYSAPTANERITGGRSNITGDFTVEEAQDLANILNSGRLSAPAKIVHEEQVGPTLGSEAIRGGTMAFLISFLVIFLLMLIYYNTGGWVANIALILNLLFTVGVLTGLGATLTAPGIAGLVLTIGMAVDTNVIIFERIKEELTRGKGYIPAINDAYKRSLPPVLDGHVTTLLTAIILFYFGLGPVKGFATTQILGLLLSLFCGILVSRWVTDIFTNKKRHLQYFTSVSRRIFQHAKYRFIEYRKVAYVISFVVLGLGIASFFNGFDYGVEFQGGRSYTVQFDRSIQNVEDVRRDLNKAFNGENTIIKTVGGNSKLDITTSYLKEDPSPNVDSIVVNSLYTGLKPYLGSMSLEKFREGANGQGMVGSKTVLPSISDDLKRGAVTATLFALIVIFLYIFIRFRDWRYSMGTIIALMHDVLVTLIVFSFAKDIVPFPLEIDQHFIAAILTVIGFSMNDTVIVFDRIREDTRLMPTAPKAEIINRAINETLSRTIMTSATVFITLLILFFLGGEVTRGFAFAMLIGVITGSYSSIFVAAPILIDLGSKKEKKKAFVDTKPAANPATVKG